MFQAIKKYFFTEEKLPVYKPVRHTFFKDPKIADILHAEGYYVADFLEEKERSLLAQLYKKNHHLEHQQDGVFFGTFSKDQKYRRTVHEEVNNILADSFSKWFVNYKSTINNYVIKTPGKSTRVPIHQDGAALDEEKYSSVNIWIPLQDATPVNGALHIIPRSHHIFWPYRCNTVPSLVRNIEHDLYPYFCPVYLKLGQVLFFDSRLFHYSTANLSDKNRVVIVSRICPKESPIVAYYRQMEKENAPVEMWQCTDDFLINMVGYNETTRPVGATLVKKMNVRTEPLTLAEFEMRRKQLGIVPQNINDLNFANSSNFLMEPVTE